MIRKHLAAVAALAALSVARPAGAIEIFFSGRLWTVKDSSGIEVGPGPNVFSADNVSVDAAGRLHLWIARSGDVWTSAEVIAKDSLGYGTYRVTYETAVDDLDVNVVVAMFTWSDNTAQSHREIDIEFSRWGDPSGPNADYVVQPAVQGSSLHRWDMPSGVARSSHGFRWTAGSVMFASYDDLGTELMTPWLFTSNKVPRPGSEYPRMNLWLFRGQAPTDGQPVEVIVSRFEWVP